MPSNDEAFCECGHVREAHEHYRDGSDCGICGAASCAAYAPAPVDVTTGRPVPRLRIADAG